MSGPEIDDYVPGIGRMEVRVFIVDLHLDADVGDDTARIAAEAVAEEINGTVSVYRDGQEIFAVTSKGIA